MSHRRKHVSQALGDSCPELQEGQRVLRVCGPRGSNILEVEDVTGTQLLVRMPHKFNKLLWVKRGSFVVADVCDTPTGDKVTGEVVMVLYEGHIRQMRKEARWPVGFDAAPEGGGGEVGAGGEGGCVGEAQGSGSGSDSDGGLPPLEANPNHRHGAFGRAHEAAGGGGEEVEEEEEEEERADLALQAL